VGVAAIVVYSLRKNASYVTMQFPKLTLTPHATAAEAIFYTKEKQIIAVFCLERLLMK
jgi:hypothetical protein